MAAQCDGQTEQISRHYLALWRMLWMHFSAGEPWVLEWIQIPSDACGRANSIWIRYVWTGKFLNPERKSCGFKNIQIRVDGASVCFGHQWLHWCCRLAYGLIRSFKNFLDGFKFVWSMSPEEMELADLRWIKKNETQTFFINPLNKMDVSLHGKQNMTQIYRPYAV